MSDAGVQVFVRQDQDATTKVQRGMHSRFAARGRYSWQEESHVQFNRWLVAALPPALADVDEPWQVNGDHQRDRPIRPDHPPDDRHLTTHALSRGRTT